MVRALLVSACALALPLVAGCGDDGDGGSASPTLGAIDGAADAGGTLAPGGRANETVGSGDVPVVPYSTDDLPIVPMGTDDIPIAPYVSSDIPAAPGQTVALPTPDGGLDARVVALTPADVCALTPRTELEAIVGMELTEPIEFDLDELGAVCSFVEDLGGGSSTVAEIELNTFDFVQQIDTSSAYVTSCTVGGRPAFCQEAFVDDSMSVDATVVVALGSDADPAMIVSSSAGLDAAIAIAELALSNLEW